jgi:hypothetical protein
MRDLSLKLCKTMQVQNKFIMIIILIFAGYYLQTIS